MGDINENVPFGYRLLRIYTNSLIFQWFSKIEINGKENISQNNPCIVLPCHQNGLIDCLTLLALFKKPMTFFAKSSIFVNSAASNFLTFLRIMPAYRQRDGIQNVPKNEDNFSKAVHLLLLGHPLCIMPEGGQNEKHHLHSFAKGPFRIAFHTQENLSEDKPIYLLPIGIDYGDYDRIGYPLVVNIAEPINVNDYMPLYKQKPAVALNVLKDAAYCSLSSNMLDIRSEQFYDVIYSATYIYNYTMLNKLQLKDSPTNRLKARQSIAKHLDEIAVQSPERLQVLADKFNNLCKGKNLDFVSMANDYPKQKLIFVLLYLVLFSCIFMYGILLNLFVVLAVIILNPRLENTGFSATIKYAIFLSLSPVNHLLFSVIAGVIFSSWIVSVLIFVTGLPLTIFCGKYLRRLRILKNRILQGKYEKYIADFYTGIDELFKM